MKITLKRSLMAVVCVLGMGSFVACDDDDDPKIPPTSTLAVQGNFEGTMGLELDPLPTPSAEEEAPAGTAVSFSIDEDEIDFDNLPVKDLVAAIMTGSTPEEIDGIVTLIGKLEYEIPYKATINAEKTEITLTTAPKNLVIKYTVPGETPTEVVVTVSVEAVGTGLYTLASQEVTFKVKATKVALGGEEMDTFKPVTLTFKAKKAIKK